MDWGYSYKLYSVTGAFEVQGGGANERRVLGFCAGRSCAWIVYIG